MPAQRWEYTTTYDTPHQLRNEDGDLARDLSELGAQGWEAVGMVNMDERNIIVLLKRPID